MPFDKFLIAPLKTGLQTNLRPWQILDDAFVELQNAYAFRGRVRKRFGSIFMGTSGQMGSRLRINIGTTDADGNIVFTSLPGTLLNAGATFSAGDIFFNVITVPLVVGNDTTLSTDTTFTAIGTVRLNSIDPNVYQFRITGSLAAIALQTVWFYPGQPVMGITQYEVGKINNHPTYAFDPQFVYIYSPGNGWSRSGTAIWHGNNTNYFFASNWQGLPGTQVLFVSNFQVMNPDGVGTATDDPLWWLTSGGWVQGGQTVNGFYFLPLGGAPQTGRFVQSALLVIPFRNRLLLLNTIENDGSGDPTAPTYGNNTNYVNRCRYSFNGSPFAQNAWYEKNQSDNSGTPAGIAAGAGYVDATTEEQIVSAEFIKDRLIVYFERSTWELAWTGNQVLPFVWQKLNTELGSQSTYSTVPFDNDILTIGATGVHACNGSNVRRIDDEIPDIIFDEFSAQASSVVRTAGIRDYDTELVYWAFLTESGAARGLVFPDQVLVFNYQNGAWALNDDCFTTFGYLEQQGDMTWESSFPTTWENYDGTWISAVNDASERQIVAGTPEGFVLIIDSDQARNAASLQITDMAIMANGIITLTVYNHNLSTDAIEFPDDTDYILLENIVADATTEAFLNGTIWPVYQVVGEDNDTITINTNGGLIAGTYYGGGTIARVADITIRTKAFNPYDKDDNNVYIQRIDFAVQRVGDFGSGSGITVDYLPGQSDVSMIQGGVQTQSIIGTSFLDTSPYDPIYAPLEQRQQMFWHPVYFQCTSESIQFVMYFTHEQMINPNISLVDFELEGFIIYSKRSGRMQ